LVCEGVPDEDAEALVLPLPVLLPPPPPQPARRIAIDDEMRSELTFMKRD
jgi:hypothetical protein